MTLALLLLGLGFQQSGFAAVALFLPRIRGELDLSFTAAGSLLSLSTLVYALMQIPAGFMADRFGARRVFLVGCLGVEAAMLGFSLVGGYWHALALMLAGGFFRSLVFAPGMVLVASRFAPERRATAMGGYVAAGFVSHIVLNLLGPMLAQALGWRAIFAGVGTAGVAAAGLFAWLGKGDARAGGPRAALTELVGLARYRVMWIASGIQYARLAIVTGVTFWLPTLLVEERGLSLQSAGLIVAVASALTVPSNLLGGYLSDRLGQPALVIGGALGVLAVTVGLIGSVQLLPLLVVVICVNAVFIQIYFGPLFSAPIDIVGQRRAGLASGLANFFANLGGFSFAYTLGAIKDATGSFRAGFLALSALAIVGVGLAVLLARERRRQAGRGVTSAATA